MSSDDVSNRGDRSRIDLASSVVMQGQGNAGLSLRSHKHREGAVHWGGGKWVSRVDGHGVPKVDALGISRQEESDDDRSTGRKIGDAGGGLGTIESAVRTQTSVDGDVVGVGSFPGVGLGVDIGDFESNGHVGDSQLDAGAKLRNYFRYIKLLSYSTKRQIYDEIFCSFRSLQLLDPGLGPSLFGRDLTLGYESGLGFGSLACGSSSPKWE